MDKTRDKLQEFFGQVDAKTGKPGVNIGVSVSIRDVVFVQSERPVRRRKKAGKKAP